MHLDEFNRADAATARAAALVWAAIPAWADALVAKRPFASTDALAATAAELARSWTRTDLDAALAHHPRIGERATGSTAEAAASRTEQASMTTASSDTSTRLATGNAAYEERFGRVFLIRAAGRSPEQMLAELERRLNNDDDTEAAEAIAQLAEIAVLRARRDTSRENAIMSSHLTTHVLDAATGLPAHGVGVVLAKASGDAVVAEVPGAVIAHGKTGEDGRLTLGPERLAPGHYVLTFLTGEYFADQDIDAFFPFVTVAFTVRDNSAAHYHVPLLLSPFAYTTYRGS